MLTMMSCVKLENNFDDIKHMTLSECGVPREALRCLKCADALCQKSCPTDLDLKSFITSTLHISLFIRILFCIFGTLPTTNVVFWLSNKNLQGGGGGVRNKYASEEGPINIGGPQQFTAEVATGRKAFENLVLTFSHNHVSLSRSISLALSFSLIFLSYIFSTSEIPQFHLPYEVVRFEADLMKDLRVALEMGHGEYGLTSSSLEGDGIQAYFIGIGEVPSFLLLPLFSFRYFVGFSIFLPFLSSREVILKKAHVTGLLFCRTEQLDNGSWVEDEEQVVNLKANYIISTFGSMLNDTTAERPWLHLQLTPEVNAKTMQTSEPWVFAGGDITGLANITVESVNNGKQTSWHIHKYIQSLHDVSVESILSLPLLYSVGDLLDISVEMCGLKFPNSFGLASAPPIITTTMIQRDLVTSASPRIVRGTTSRHGQVSFHNIELISEKAAAYWCQGMTRLKKKKKKLPHNDIMCRYNEDDQTGQDADAVEMNLSCPHGMGERGMGQACGQRLTRHTTRYILLGFLGADGDMATNTVSGMMRLRGDTTPWPSSSKSKKTTYRGALNPAHCSPHGVVSATARALPGFPILATGGIDCSSSTLDHLSSRDGLKALLYLKSIEELSDWDGQSPPTPSHSFNTDLITPVLLCFLWAFLSVQDVIAKALKHIGAYQELDNKEQVQALIDPEIDSGYLAIKFDPETHLPVITDSCTGCTLSLSVRPIIDCIRMVTRATPYVPKGAWVPPH
uniref:Dihydropyrimidine dehydrogenase b n=1 Tax=Pygocentrus nattereri TaxID=42514 RepID=A0AAR2K849_PYGNA